MSSMPAYPPPGTHTTPAPAPAAPASLPHITTDRESAKKKNEKNVEEYRNHTPEELGAPTKTQSRSGQAYFHVCFHCVWSFYFVYASADGCVRRRFMQYYCYHFSSEMLLSLLRCYCRVAVCCCGA
jgi:hypothetical protein